MNLERMYKRAVERKIRERYSMSDELALLRQRDLKIDEFDEYDRYCESCKTEAKAWITERAKPVSEEVEAARKAKQAALMAKLNNRKTATPQDNL